MRAQASAVAFVAAGNKLEDLPDDQINRHFAWLAPLSTRATSRHLVDGQADGATGPLLTKAARSINSYPDDLRSIFSKHLSIGLEDRELLAQYVQSHPTRISCLIKNSIRDQGDSLIERRGGEKNPSVKIPSPLKLCYDILCVPESTGSFPYAFVSVKNFLIESFQTSSKIPFADFDETDLSNSIEAMNTSMRSRYNSRGRDKLPVNQPGTFSQFLREFLCLTGLFSYRFKRAEDATNYLGAGRFEIGGRFIRKSGAYEYDRRARLSKLPESGDLVNQIWGLPLPIRGADVIFRGGLRFPDRKGLVVALHGGPGTGKTSLALGLGASLSGFGIRTLFFTAEERKEDLHTRAASLVPAAYRRLDFFPKSTSEWLDPMPFEFAVETHRSALQIVTAYFKEIKERLSKEIDANEIVERGVKSPCRAVVVLDGLHDLLNRSDTESTDAQISQQLYHFVEECKELQALVILTTGEDFKLGAELDYQVDTAIHLTHDTSSQEGGKPERLMNLAKARHQSCSAGTHSFQISGEKGVRFTPQTNFCLELDAIWDLCLHDDHFEKHVLTKVARRGNWESKRPRSDDFVAHESVRIFRSSNVFLNGVGSGGKAGMALKIASAPYFEKRSIKPSKRKEKILIVSFLYPEQYYRNIHAEILNLKKAEFGDGLGSRHSRIEVVKFYPGFLKAHTLFSRIEWLMIEHEALGDPFTSVILDGLHNIFIQFPDLEKHKIIWPQIYSMLRKRDVSILTTHTVLTVPSTASDGARKNIEIDDNRSDPLRHALVQKTDFSFEIDPVYPTDKNGLSAVEYEVRALSAIGQPLPREKERLCWHRENLFFYQGEQIGESSEQSLI